MKKLKKLLAVLLAAALLASLSVPISALAALKLKVNSSAVNTKSRSITVLTKDGQTIKKVEPGQQLYLNITLTPKAGCEFKYVMVGNAYSFEQDSEYNKSAAANLTLLTDLKGMDLTQELELRYSFTVPDVTLFSVRIVCGEPSEPEPAPQITISANAGSEIEYDSGAVEFLGVVTDANIKETGDSDNDGINDNVIAEGEVQYYLNNEKLSTPVRFDRGRTEKGYYRSVSSDMVFDETALKMGENSVYAFYDDGDGHTAQSNTVKITVVEKDISERISPA